MVPWHSVLNDQNLIAAILQYLQVVCYLFSHLCYHKSFAAKIKSKYMCLNSRIKQQQLKICKGSREPGEKAEWRNGALWKADLRLASFWDSGWCCQGCPSWADIWSPHAPLFDQIFPSLISTPSILALQLKVTQLMSPLSSHQAPFAPEFLFLQAAFGDTDWLKAVMQHKQYQK